MGRRFDPCTAYQIGKRDVIVMIAFRFFVGHLSFVICHRSLVICHWPRSGLMPLAVGEARRAEPTVNVPHMSLPRQRQVHCSKFIHNLATRVYRNELLRSPAADAAASRS